MMNSYFNKVMWVPLVFILFCVVSIVYVFIDMPNTMLNYYISSQKIEYISYEKHNSKTRVNNIVKYIREMEKLFPDDLQKQKILTAKFIRDNQNLEKYIFVFSDVKLSGGDKFAKMYINPNRPNLIGKYINDNYKDAHGKEFRKEVLEKLIRHKEGFVQYYYKKIDSNKIEDKISYFKYIDKFHWIIATGVYYDTIKEHNSLVIKEFKSKIREYMYMYLKIFGFLSIIFSIVLLVFIVKIRKSLKIKDISLKKRSDILKVIIKIQQLIIKNNNFNNNVNFILKNILNTIGVDRVYIFENCIVDGKLCCSRKFECVADGIEVQINNQKLQNIPYKVFPRWKNILFQGDFIEGLVCNFPKNEKDILEPQNILSILVLPIFHDDKWWGFIGFDDCKKYREWTNIEKDSLQIVASSFISALEKNMYYKNLKNIVRNQLKDIRKKDGMLIQQAKMASMGEMIGNIAHQWRQPLNIIGASLIGLQLRYENNMLDDKFIEDYSDKLNKTIQNMSQTIEDFRNFFKPIKSKEKFSIKECLEETIKLIKASFTVHNIEINIYRDSEHILYAHKNEFTQIILVILNNSKDAIMQNSISQGKIDVKIYGDEEFIYIDICDNGGGIKPEIFSKLFEPYFTTKFKKQGTGIGLYMIKQILQKHMKGDLAMENYQDGLKSMITLPKLRGEERR